ncbi:MAG: sel1 repeat family protein [Synergistaceae bacterium]|nr:sel1 repeat family protein [Synergistaceae bacterium]
MFRLYRYFAVKGDSVAWHNLGLAYVLGRGVKTDYARAMYWFSSAAEAGHPDAQNDLAFMYEAGMGVPKDRDRAIKLYKTAARWGSKMARKNLERLGVFVSSDQSGIE